MLRYLKRAFQGIIRGDFLVSMKVGQYFIHIIWTFFLFFLSIWLSLQVEKTLTRVEQGKKALEDTQIYHAQKEAEWMSLQRMTTIREMLQEKGSAVNLPEKPAARIEKKK